MPLLSAYIVPHPPLAVPEVGKGQEKQIPETMKAYREIADEIARQAPDTIILVSPHNRFCREFFYISDGSSWASSFRDFRVYEPIIRMNYDEDMIRDITRAAKRAGIPAGNFGETLLPSRQGDHGSLVPLYFLAKAAPSNSTTPTASAPAAEQAQPADNSDNNTDSQPAATLDLAPEIVRLSITSFSHEKHWDFGRVIGRYLEKSPKRVIFIASGDLSHRLKEDGPYGLSAEAPAFEKRLVEALDQGDFQHVVSLSSDLCEEVGECGIRGFCILGGVLDGTSYTSQVLSHEDTFGVGYAVARYWPKPPATSLHADSTSEPDSRDLYTVCEDKPNRSSTKFSETEPADQAAANSEVDSSAGDTAANKQAANSQAADSQGGKEGGKRDARDARDARDTRGARDARDARGAEERQGILGNPYTDLARRAVEVRVKTGRQLELSGVIRHALPQAMTKHQAACFVSIHYRKKAGEEEGALRGCIGTIRAMGAALADEIVQNAMSAALEDPRFPPITAKELPELVYSVDVLGSPEDVATPDELDVKRFGVIVSSGYRRGLLLPDLVGVDTVEQQIAIAKRKAGIPQDEPCRLQRFTVTRYSEEER